MKKGHRNAAEKLRKLTDKMVYMESMWREKDETFGNRFLGWECSDVIFALQEHVTFYNDWD